MPQITLLAILAALITFLLTSPIRAITPEEQAAQDKISEETKARPLTPDEAQLISEKIKLMKQEHEHRQRLLDGAE